MRKAYFSSLSARLGLAAAGVALVTGLAISLAGYFAVRHQEDQARSELVAQHVGQQALRIADRVEVMMRGLSVAVSSSLLASAMVDSAGKELYIQPFLDRLSVHAGVVASIYFVDFEGRVAMHSYGAAPSLPVAHDWVAGRVTAGQPALLLLPGSDGGELIFLTPLIYERTHRPEGALLARVRLHDLGFIPGSSLHIVEAQAAAARGRQEAVVPLDPQALGTTSTLVLRDDRVLNRVEESFGSRAGEVLVLGLLLSMGVAVVVAKPVARSTLRDVDRLVGQLQALGEHTGAGGRQVTEVGSEEVRGIARAVNAMLAALEAANRGFQRERELRMAGIIESSNDAIITLDAQHRIVQFNAAAGSMFRVPAEQALGGTVDRFVPLPERARHGAMIREFASSGDMASRRMGRARSFNAVRADGEIFHAEAMLTKARIDGQDYMTVLIRDITDQVAAEGERAARAVAEAANKEKTAFLARMSHELRTPLNAIHGFAELMLRRHQAIPPEQQRQYLDLIVESSRRLTALINDLLDVSRIELGELDVQVTSVDVMAVAHAAMAELDGTARAAGIELRWDAPDLPQWAMADEGRLHQVVSNLVSNAIKYNHRGGKVEVAAGQQEGRLVLEVRDNGMGMGPEQLAALYQPFNRLGRDAQAPGTGIGLTITQHLVRVMGGEITVRSEPGQGSCFSVRLVPGPAPTVAAPMPRPRDAVIETRSDLAGQLLYVEDNPINQQVLLSCMELRPGVTVRLADTARAALDAMHHELPDLLLVDMMLPDMHGTDLARQLRQEWGERCPPMVAYSASALAYEIAAARAAGFAGYVVKPAPADELLGTIDRLLMRSREAADAAPRRR